MLQSGHILCQAPPRQRLQERPAAFNMKMAQRKDGAAVQVVLPPLLATAGATGGEGMGGGGWETTSQASAADVAAGGGSCWVSSPLLDSPDPCRSWPALLGMLPWQEGGGHKVGRQRPLAFADPRGRHQQQQAPQGRRPCRGMHGHTA